MLSKDDAYYRAEAERCRRLAANEASEDAREYYEALERDYLKLAAAMQRANASGSVG
jgi:hypothetical protein